jgi:hypothetical protein
MEVMKQPKIWHEDLRLPISRTAAVEDGFNPLFALLLGNKTRKNADELLTVLGELLSESDLKEMLTGRLDKFGSDCFFSGSDPNKAECIKKLWAIADSKRAAKRGY